MDTTAIQRALIALGYDLGKGGLSGKGDDGFWGDKTSGAIIAFQRANKLLGDLGERTIAALTSGGGAKPAPTVPVAAVPADWTPAARMQRIIVHWTAGNHKASTDDRKHYHLLIEGDGTLVRGVPSIALNDASGVKPGYAAHTLNCNTGSIGVSLCCMAGAVESPFNPGKAPMTREQWAALPQVVADLCRRYAIPVTPKTVLSHAEVQGTLGITQRGKWDISRLPFDSSVSGAKACGDAFRQAAGSLLGT